MLATQANVVIKEDRLKKGSIVRVNGYQANAVKGKNILVILSLDVLDGGPFEKFGTPSGLQDPAAAPAVPPQNASMSGAGFYGSSTMKKEESTQDTKPNLGLPTRNPPSDKQNNIYPIEGLSPYSRAWTIKARVTQKSQIRTWHKSNSEGKLFSVNLLDESGEIKATGFNDAVDQWYDILQEGSVYYISTPCRVSMAKKQFTNLPHDYEITFEKDTKIEKVEGASNLPTIKINPLPLSDLISKEKDSNVDVIGVIKEVGDVSEAIAKSGKPYQKREVILVDDSVYSTRLTVWNNDALNFAAEPESVVAFRGCKVSDFGGRSLSLLASGSMVINPDIADAHRLKGWWDATGRNTGEFANHRDAVGGSAGTASGMGGQEMTIRQVKENNLGHNPETPDYFTIKATIVYIKQDNFSYPACRTEGCNKKVTNMGDGWKCEKDQAVWDTPTYRYILSVNVCDHTGTMWLSCFDDVGRIVMGRSADDLMQMQEEDEARRQAAFDSANCTKLVFRCRAKMDMYDDNPRVRYQVIGATPVDFKSDGHRLADQIKKMSMQT